jgi:4-amino-4-deoxy-L-arabinose transferase-like glycosyltransferase
MDGLNYAKLMDLFNAQTGTVNTLWNIFVAVPFGVLGFVFAALIKRRREPARANNA